MGSMATTIQYQRAQQIAHASTLGVSVGRILGHVAAHEIGHVLLGSNTHDSFGVMSATFGKRDLVSMAQGRLLFTAEEARLLRNRLSRETLDRGTQGGCGPKTRESNKIAILNSKNLQCARLNQ